MPGANRTEKDVAATLPKAIRDCLAPTHGVSWPHLIPMMASKKDDLKTLLLLQVGTKHTEGIMGTFFDARRYMNLTRRKQL